VVHANSRRHFWTRFTGQDSDIQLSEEELDDYKWIKKEEFKDYFESPEYLEKVLAVIDEMIGEKREQKT